jgi:hypothetical protein
VATLVRVPVPGEDSGRLEVHEWALAQDETGAALSVPLLADRSIQVSGTFGGATVTVEGANNPTSPVWHTLNDSRGEGNALSFTTADTRQISEITTQIRLKVTGGDGTTAIIATLACIRGR